MKLLFLIIIFSAILLNGHSQGVKWTKFEDLNDSITNEKKPVIVKIETPWCGYCKLMDSKVYSKKGFAKRIGKNYYFVKLNADNRGVISFNQTEYSYRQYSGPKGVHSLAKELAEVDGVLQYPTTVVLNSDLEFNKRIVGYLNQQDLKYWLQYSEE